MSDRMQVRLKCEKPDEIEYTMIITMKAKDWEALREQTSSSWPGWELKNKITDLLAQARKIYWPKEEEADV